MKSISILPLVASLSVITILGLTIVLSIFPSLFSNQLLFFLAGLFLLIASSKVNGKALQQGSLFLYLFSILLLIFTLILGNVTRGSVRWIDLGIFKLQPSELSKPFLIAFFADQFLRPIQRPIPWLIRNGLLLSIPSALVFIQPDLGSTIVFVGIWFGMLLSSRFPKKILATLSLFAIVVMPFGYHFLQDYQKKRLETFINPFANPSGSGYNVIQAMIAVGSGNILGKGVRQGTQSHLRFLPERHTDFAFASFAEEFGFLGVTILVLSFLSLLLWLTNLMEQLDDYGRLVVSGVFWLFFIQVVINIGMNMGVLPVTGITLPFISYGGSSILSSAIALGFVLSMRKTRREQA